MITHFGSHFNTSDHCLKHRAPPITNCKPQCSSCPSLGFAQATSSSLKRELIRHHRFADHICRLASQTKSQHRESSTLHLFPRGPPGIISVDFVLPVYPICLPSVLRCHSTLLPSRRTHKCRVFEAITIKYVGIRSTKATARTGSIIFLPPLGATVLYIAVH